MNDLQMKNHRTPIYDYSQSACQPANPSSFKVGQYGGTLENLARLPAGQDTLKD
jgi:hypothetical protein